MYWGHEVRDGDKTVKLTRLQYNENAGAESPLQPIVPLCAQHVWDWWWEELNPRRGRGFDLPEPIPFSEIKSWIYLLQIRTTPEEIRWLTKMDNAYLEQYGSEKSDKSDRERERADMKAGNNGRRKGRKR